MNHVEKKTDTHSTKSSIVLKAKVNSAIKHVFVNALKCIEIKFGTDFAGYENIRKEILRSGNDAIRDINEIIDNEFNVECIPSVLTIRFKEMGKAGTNGRTEK